METNKQGETGTVAELPFPISMDLFLDILSRLSIKDLHRPTSFSSWRDAFINFPDIRKNIPQTLQGFFYTGWRSCRLHGGNRGGNVMDGGSGGNIDAAADSYGLHSLEPLAKQFTPADSYGFHFLDLLPKSMPVPASVDTSLSFLPSLPSGGSTNLMCSCNGLLLLGRRKSYSERYDSLGYIVCNPATKQWVTVPSSGWILTGLRWTGDEKFASTFLFFDPDVPSRFLLIQFWHGEDGALEEVHIYSSQAREWSNRSGEWTQFAKGGKWGREHGVKIERLGSPFVNGMLHFLVQRKQKQGVLIVAIDGEGNICRKPIRRPVPKHAKPVFIGQSQGVLHCFSVYKDRTFEGRGGSSTGAERARAPTANARIIESPQSLSDRLQPIEPWLKKRLEIPDYYDTSSHIGIPRTIVHINAFPVKRSFKILISDLHEENEYNRMGNDSQSLYRMSREKDYQVVAIHPDGDLLYLVNRANGELIQYHMGRHSNPRDKKVLRLCTLEHGYGPLIPYVPCFSWTSALVRKEDSENPV